MEMYWNSEPKVATNVFELGLKSFAKEPEYVLRYLDFLISQNNGNSAFFSARIPTRLLTWLPSDARALFERTVAIIEPAKAKPIWDRMAQYEFQYGDYLAAQKMAQRYAETFPDSAPPRPRFASARQADPLASQLLRPFASLSNISLPALKMRSRSTSALRSSGRSSATLAPVRRLLSVAATSATSLSTATAQTGTTRTAATRSGLGEEARLRLRRLRRAEARAGGRTGPRTTAAARARLRRPSTALSRTCSTRGGTTSPSCPTPSSSSSRSCRPLRASTARTSTRRASWTSSARPSCLAARPDLACPESDWAFRRDRSLSDRRTAAEVSLSSASSSADERADHSDLAQAVVAAAAAMAAAGGTDPLSTSRIFANALAFPRTPSLGPRATCAAEDRFVRGKARRGVRI